MLMYQYLGEYNDTKHLIVSDNVKSLAEVLCLNINVYSLADRFDL